MDFGASSAWHGALYRSLHPAKLAELLDGVPLPLFNLQDKSGKSVERLQRRGADRARWQNPGGSGANSTGGRRGSSSSESGSRIALHERLSLAPELKMKV